MGIDWEKLEAGETVKHPIGSELGVVPIVFGGQKVYVLIEAWWGTGEGTEEYIVLVAGSDRECEVWKARRRELTEDCEERHWWRTESYEMGVGYEGEGSRGGADAD